MCWIRISNGAGTMAAAGSPAVEYPRKCRNTAVPARAGDRLASADAHRKTADGETQAENCVAALTEEP